MTPKYKIAQIIRKEGFNERFKIVDIKDGFYFNDHGDYFPVSAQDDWELVEDLCWCDDLDLLAIGLEETIGTSPHSRDTIKEYLQKAMKLQEEKDKELLDDSGVIVLSEDEFEKMKRSLIQLASEKEKMKGQTVPGTVVMNKYGNKQIVSWSGLKEYDDLLVGEEVNLVIVKK